MTSRYKERIRWGREWRPAICPDCGWRAEIEIVYRAGKAYRTGMQTLCACDI